MPRRGPQQTPGDQQSYGQAIYLRRKTTDTNAGLPAARACPCLILMLIWDEALEDGWHVLHCLCPSCAAGWVREESCPKDEPRPHDECAEGAQ